MRSVPWKLARHALFVLAVAATGAAGISAAAPRTPGLEGLTAPVIDGDGTDLINFAAGLGVDGCAFDAFDLRDDIIVSDPKLISCSPQEDTDAPPDGIPDYFVNGFDLRRFVLAYDRPNRVLYLLWRTEGFIGDMDGNLNPDNSACNPSASFGDGMGIGSQENYQARIDTNCDGAANILISIGGGVSPDAVTVEGASIGGIQMAYRQGVGSGRDLELRISDIDLPFVLHAFANTGASFDGLGEDITRTSVCGVADPFIDLEQSFSEPLICRGGSSDISLVVTNKGSVDLEGVTVVDDLPTGLVFQSTVSNSCGGAFSSNGNRLTFGPFHLARGASCSIIVRVGQTGECSGEQVNIASVEGFFLQPCLNGGTAMITSDKASASILCGGLVCAIDAPDTQVCPGETVEICGPEGTYTYLWSTGATSRCINVGAGTWSLVLGSGEAGCVSTPCEVTVLADPTACASGNCPRTVGFWSQQCAQRSGGSTKFGRSEMDQITACIDATSSYFGWSNAFEGFCSIIDPSKMDQRKQAKRQYAGMLANLCTGQLGLVPSNGNDLFLDPNTPIDCGGFTAGTVGELIAEIDGMLAELEGHDLSSDAVKAKYTSIIGCTGALNEGTSIQTTPGCEHGGLASGSTTGGSGDPDFIDVYGIELYKPFPNPFNRTTQFAFEVTPDDGAVVDVAIYDVSGRKIRTVVSGMQPAGRQVASWDGRNDEGVTVTRGVYFVRAVLDGWKAPVQRLLFVR